MFDFEIIKKLYTSLSKRIDFAKNILKRPLTYTEKILYSHLFESKFDTEFLRMKSYVEFSKYCCCDLLVIYLVEIKRSNIIICSILGRFFILLFINSLQSLSASSIGRVVIKYFVLFIWKTLFLFLNYRIC